MRPGCAQVDRKLQEAKPILHKTGKEKLRSLDCVWDLEGASRTSRQWFHFSVNIFINNLEKSKIEDVLIKCIDIIIKININKWHNMEKIFNMQ